MNNFRELYDFCKELAAGDTVRLVEFGSSFDCVHNLNLARPKDLGIFYVKELIKSPMSYVDDRLDLVGETETYNLKHSTWSANTQGLVCRPVDHDFEDEWDRQIENEWHSPFHEKSVAKLAGSDIALQV